MKFEDKIKNVLENLDEAIQAPQTMGAPVSNNPAQVAPQQVAPQQGQAGEQQQELTADAMFNWAMEQDPKTTGEIAKLEGDAKLQAIADAMANQQAQNGDQPNAQMNPVAASNNQQATSANPATANTSGTMGATSTQV